jgi:hypothetical protein
MLLASLSTNDETSVLLGPLLSPSGLASFLSASQPSPQISTKREHSTFVMHGSLSQSETDSMQGDMIDTTDRPAPSSFSAKCKAPFFLPSGVSEEQSSSRQADPPHLSSAPIWLPSSGGLHKERMWQEHESMRLQLRCLEMRARLKCVILRSALHETDSDGAIE